MNRPARLSKRAVGLAVATSALAALTLVPVGAAVAAPTANPAAASTKGCDVRNNNSVVKLLKCIATAGIVDHLDAFQAIADANGGNRAAGLPGYDGSVEYVVETLEDAGWNVALDEFPYTFVGPSTLTQLTPVNADYETGPYTGSGSGDVEGTVVPVDVVLGQPNSTAVTSGCEPTDFDGLDFTGSTDIALLQRGTCPFGVKAANAEAAGAEAVIIFNQGNSPDREALIVGTLEPSVVAIPVVGASYAQGVALAEAGSTAFISVPAPEQRPQVNVIAELPGKNTQNVVMAGAHLDSVQAGPGINDNGSGSAGLLEVAQLVSKLKPQNTLRFAWWGAEESGLIGSNEYVAELSQAEKDRIALYLNFDMIASPNYIYGVYDGDQSTFPAPVGVPVPEGSVQIEDLFEQYFTLIGEPYEDTQFSGRSDYQAFILNGIPAGGLFTGAEVVKTQEQAAIWGGVAGDQFDECYHLVCDTIDNVNTEALLTNTGAVAFATIVYAYSTETVNGVPGKRLPGVNLLPQPRGPEGTFLPEGGGLAPDHDHDHEPHDID